MTGDIQLPSALALKLPSEFALGGEPLEASRSSQEGLIARLERLLQRMGAPVVRQRPDADGQGLVSDTACRTANLSLPGRSAWLPPPWRQPAWPAMAGRSAWTAGYGLDNARSFERPGALAGGARCAPAAAAPATASGARTPGWPEPRQIRLEINEDQNFDHNSGARQRLLALEQLGFTLAMDDDGTGHSGLQRLTPSP